MSGAPLGVAIVGCGLIGVRRARAAAEHEGTRVAVAVDVNAERCETLAGEWGARPTADWRDAVSATDVDVVVVSTPNAYLAEIATAALDAGRHVLLEKPMGRSLEEARRIAGAAEKSGAVLKVGFNHRYHPALERAHALVEEGTIGSVINLRARYGHGGRPGMEKEWRGSPELAGGGHLTDQGVHLVDLIHWFAGLPDRSVAFLQTAVWPIAPLEDNAFALFQWSGGRVAQLHASMTQWKNLFSFEVFGERGSIVVEGLGGSYGQERLTLALRRPEGGVPELREETFGGEDRSWRLEWDDFVGAVRGGTLRHGTAADGVAAMRMIAALYRSHASGGVVDV